MPKRLDFFPNCRNSVHIATWQIIGHALLSTNFNTLQPHFGLSIMV